VDENGFRCFVLNVTQPDNTNVTLEEDVTLILNGTAINVTVVNGTDVFFDGESLNTTVCNATDV